MPRRKKTWVERINFTSIDDDADLIDHLEYAVYRSCRRLGWDMSRTREGDNFRKIETWLPHKDYPETVTVSNVDIYLDTNRQS